MNHHWPPVFQQKSSTTKKNGAPVIHQRRRRSSGLGMDLGIHPSWLDRSIRKFRVHLVHHWSWGCCPKKNHQRKKLRKTNSPALKEPFKNGCLKWKLPLPARFIVVWEASFLKSSVVNQVRKRDFMWTDFTTYEVSFTVLSFCQLAADPWL